MAYTKKVWKNGDDVTEHDLNRIETGIESHVATLAQHEIKIDNLSVKDTDLEDKINVLIATTSVTEIPFPFNVGYTHTADLPSSDACSVRKLGKMVEVIINAKRVDGGEIVAGASEILGTLPVGYRPKYLMRFVTGAFPYGTHYTCFIAPNGNICIRHCTGKPAEQIYGSIVFIVE